MTLYTNAFIYKGLNYFVYKGRNALMYAGLNNFVYRGRNAFILTGLNDFVYKGRNALVYAGLNDFVSSEGALYLILPYDYTAAGHFLSTNRSSTTT